MLVVVTAISSSLACVRCLSAELTGIGNAVISNVVHLLATRAFRSRDPHDCSVISAAQRS